MGKSRDLCSVTVLGRMTKDPELSTVGNGLQLAKFSIAVNEGADKDGNEYPASFYDVEAWGKVSEVIGNFFHKGSRILIRGRLRHSRWETPEGAKRSKVSIVLQDFNFIDKKSDNGGYNTPPPGYTPQQSNNIPQQSVGISDDDVPF